jgi:hydrogenase maturation protease
VGTLVIGVGNALRGDDGAGLAAAEVLRARVANDVTVESWDGPPMELLDRWTVAERVIVIDAVTSGAPVGTIHRFDASAAPLLDHVSAQTTHGVGLAQAIELGRAFGRLPRSLVVYGIEGREFEIGREPSERVRRAVSAVVERVIEEVAADAPEG